MSNPMPINYTPPTKRKPSLTGAKRRIKGAGERKYLKFGGGDGTGYARERFTKPAPKISRKRMSRYAGPAGTHGPVGKGY